MKERFNKVSENGIRVVDFLINKQPHALILLSVIVASAILAAAQKSAVLAGISAAGIGTGLIMVKNEIRRTGRNKK